MIEKEQIKMTGELVITKTTETGKIEVIRINNLVVSTGKSHMISRMMNDDQGTMNCMGVGTGTVSPTLSDVALGTALGARIPLTSMVQGTAPNDNTVTYATTYNPGISTGAITEAGIFNSISAITATAGSFVVGTEYTVVSVGTTDYTLVGASVNTIGETFVATGVGSGTGTASSPAGQMLCRTSFPVVNKEVGDTIAITWVVTIS